MPAARGSGIEKNDTISTTSQGRFRITFVDSTNVNITENSRLVIDDFVFDGNAKAKGRLGLKVALGTVRYASGGIAHGNTKGVNIRTPTATIGVRGTDFVMSVDEAGRTMVVLLPACFDDADMFKDTNDCEVGEIEVITASGVVTMNQPFQATVVESSFVPPSPPTTVNMTMKQLDNNLQISAPASDSGESVIGRARRDLKKSTNPAAAAADDNQDPDVGASIEQVAVIIQQPPTQDELYQIFKEFNPEKELVATLQTNVSPYLEKQVQVGWVYSSLSQDAGQLTTIFLEKTTDTEIIVVQNGLIDYFNFADHKWPTSGMGRSQGSITIWQSNK